MRTIWFSFTLFWLSFLSMKVPDFMFIAAIPFTFDIERSMFLFLYIAVVCRADLVAYVTWLLAQLNPLVLWCPIDLPVASTDPETNLS